MSIIMTGGGTGGHLAIIKAVKEQLGDEELIYIGSTKGQDRQWFAEDDDFRQKYFLETRGVVNQGMMGKVKSIMMLGRNDNIFHSDILCYPHPLSGIIVHGIELC